MALQVDAFPSLNRVTMLIVLAAMTVDVGHLPMKPYIIMHAICNRQLC